MDEAKDDMIDIVKFLQNPEPFNQVGAKIPKGQVKVIVHFMAIVQINVTTLVMTILHVKVKSKSLNRSRSLFKSRSLYRSWSWSVYG